MVEKVLGLPLVKTFILRRVRASAARPPAARAWCPVPAPLPAPASKKIVLLPQRGKDDLLVLHGEEVIPVRIPEFISPEMTHFLSQILGCRDRHLSG